MAEHPIEGMMDTTLEKIKQMVDGNTIIGNPITSPDGTLIIPVSKVTYGFASGGSDLPTKKQDGKELFGGGGGAGITISPVAFLTICNGEVKVLQVENFQSSVDRIISLIPEMWDKITTKKRDSKCNCDTKKNINKLDDIDCE